MNSKLPQARIPLGFVSVNGQRVPVEISMEWMRALSNITQGAGASSVDPVVDELVAAALGQQVSQGQDASRAIDELRNELASTRTDTQTLRTLIDEQTARIEGFH